MKTELVDVSPTRKEIKIEIEPEVLVVDLREHAPPNGGGDRQVLAAGPLVSAEEHGAVFDADLDAGRRGVADDVGP